MKKFVIVLMLISGFFLCSTSAFAYYIDFASDTFSVVEGEQKIVVQNVYGDIDILLWTNPNMVMTHNPGPGGGVDGIGINDDEIGDYYHNQTYVEEDLHFTFGHGTSVSGFIPASLFLYSIDFTDLFYNDNGSGGNETGFYVLFTDSQQMGGSFTQDDSTKLPYQSSNGEYRLPVGDYVCEGVFYAWNQDPYVTYFGNDFSLRGMSIPEPATMLLLGSGLIGLAIFGRKRLFKKS